MRQAPGFGGHVPQPRPGLLVQASRSTYRASDLGLSSARKWHGRINRWRFGLAPQLITVVLLAVLVVGGILSAITGGQSKNIPREQIIPNNLASTELAGESAYDYVEITQLAHNPEFRRAVLTGNFSAAMVHLREFLMLGQRLDRPCLGHLFDSSIRAGAWEEL